MHHAIISMLLSLVLFCGAKDLVTWQELEKEVIFTPWSGARLDTLRSWYGIAPQHELAQPIATHSLPPYEKMVYNLNWGTINGGYAILESEHRGDTLILTGKAMSNKFVSKFYKVRDYTYSVGSSSGLFPFYFEQGVKEKDFVENRWTMYDFARSTIYRNTGKEFVVNTINGFQHNYLSLLYALRTKSYKLGDSFSLPTFVHDKAYNIRFNVIKKETLKTLGSERECFKVQPILVGKGTHGFNEKDHLYLWITADEEQVVVKIKAKARLGYVVCKLSYYDNGVSQWHR